jgi:hypothetical protein
MYSIQQFLVILHIVSVTANICGLTNKVRELIAVKVLHTLVLNITVVAYKALPLGSYALMPVPSHSSKQFWNWFCHITPDVINAIQMPSFEYFLYYQEQKSHLELHLVNRGGVPAQIFVY